MQTLARDARPWLGLASFTEANAAQFFGREAEVAELVRRLSRKGLTVLFGQSGLGKTSMLQAGVVPRLREAGFAPVLLRMDYSAESPSCEAQMLAALGWPTDEGLWEQFHRRDREGPAPLLIFDQFEEVFTLGQADEAGRAKAQAFLAEFADLVENRVPAALEAKLEDDDSLFDRYDLQRADFRLLISLREDYLAHLEPLKAQMPGITQNRMRIAPMTGEQALQAVCGPGGELVSTDTAEAIVCFVSGAKTVQHAEVEPALLSLILRELNEQRIAKQQAQITPDLLAGSHAAILSDFYERSLADQPQGVRHFIEDQLLTDTGYRENVAEERVKQAFATAGAAQGALEQLVNRRLLRVEERLDRRRVELTHDTLCAVVAQSREVRQERQRAEAAERQAAEQRAQAQAAQAREQAQRRQLVRARQLAAGAALLSLLTAGAGYTAWRSAQRAQAAEVRSEQTRANAEGLVGFLLDDFYDELAPVGRLDVLQRLSTQALGYYDKLPDALRDDRTRLGQALAQLRQVQILGQQGRLAEAEPLLAAAHAALSAQFDAGSRAPQLLIGLTRSAAHKANVRLLRLQYTEGMQEVAAALPRLRDLAEQPGAPQALRRELASLMDIWARMAYFGASDHVATIERMQAARTLTQPLDASSPGEQDMRIRLGGSSWLVQSLAESGAYAEAHAVAQADAGWLTARLRERPDDAGARVHLALLSSALTVLALTELDPQAALRWGDDSQQAWTALRAWDTSSTRFNNNLAASLYSQSRAHQAAGRYDAALQATREAGRVWAQQPGSNSFSLSNELRNWYEGLDLLLDLGRAREAQAWYADGAGVRQRLGAARSEGVAPSAWRVLLDLAAERMRQAGLLPQVAQASASSTPDDALMSSSLAIARMALSRSGAWALERHMLAGDWTAAAGTAAAQVQRTAVTLVAFTHPRLDEHLQAGLSLALAQARLGRTDDARQTLAPLLDRVQARVARNKGSVWVPVELAMARYVESQLGGPTAAAALREARAVLAGVPAHVKSTRSVQLWVRWIQAG